MVDATPGYREGESGSSGGKSVWRVCLMLLAFTAGALALTALTARPRQVWTVDRLHPEIAL